MSPPLSDEQAARVEAHTLLVRKAAQQVASHSSVLSFEDLESVGNEALVRAAMRYDPSSPASFATYAHYRVRGAMIDAIRARTPGRRKQKRALSRLQATQALLSQAAEDQAARRSAGDLQTLTQRVAAARELVRRASMVIEMSESVPVSADVVAADEPDPEQQLVDADRRARIRELIAGLEPDERALVQAIYVHGRTLKDYADELGTSPSTISRRHTRLLDRLGKHMRESK